MKAGIRDRTDGRCESGSGFVPWLTTFRGRPRRKDDLISGPCATFLIYTRRPSTAGEGHGLDQDRTGADVAAGIDVVADGYQSAVHVLEIAGDGLLKIPYFLQGARLIRNPLHLFQPGKTLRGRGAGPQAQMGFLFFG